MTLTLSKESSCFQCVKGNKFESDSQLLCSLMLVVVGCFQCVKGNKFESDSQHADKLYVLRFELFPMCQR